MDLKQTPIQKRGLKSDKLLLDAIMDYPGLSQYELSQKLRWNSGHVDGAIRRLVNENLVAIKSLERNGRIVNLIYPKDSKPADLIEIPINLLQFENGQWHDCAFVYALDSTTIGITGQETLEWKEFAGFTETTPIKKNKTTIALNIPDKFSRFYKIERKHKTTSVNGNKLLITISGNLIQEKKYPA
jgi:hypothetical protein